MPDRLVVARIGVVCCAALTISAITATMAYPQKIICWKDKAGKVVGCGDRVPQEYLQNETNTLDRHGIMRETKVSAEEAARLREEKKKNAALKAEEDKRIADERRQDMVLINTYTSTKEIDLRRDRELQVVDLQLTQLQVSLKNAIEAQSNMQKRHDNYIKSSKPVPERVLEDLDRVTEERTNIESRMASKEKEKDAIRTQYARQRARFIELRGESEPSAAVKDKK